MSANTVWLASYPKSGNTWMRALLRTLTRQEESKDPLDINDLRGGPIGGSRHHVERRLGFPASDLRPAELDRLRPACDALLDAELENVRFRKIHDGIRTRRGALLVDPQTTRAAVYVIRDPRDVAVSFAHFMGKPMEWSAAKLGDPRAALAGGRGIGSQLRQYLGTWGDHVRGWVEHELFPVVVVRYEDLLEDAGRELARAAQVAGVPASPERIAEAVEAASFDRLREQEDEVGFGERPLRMTRFFRRGQAGAWRDELPEPLAAQVERDHGEVMERFGYTRELVTAEAPA